MILRDAHRGATRIEFLREISKMLMEFCRCDAVELWLHDPSLHFRWEASERPERTFRFVIIRDDQTAGLHPPEAVMRDTTGLEQLCSELMRGHFDPAAPFFTRNGSYWTGDTQEPACFRFRPSKLASHSGSHPRTSEKKLVTDGPYRSLTVVPFAVSEKKVGLLHLKSLRTHHFTREKVEQYEGLAQTVGLAVAIRQAQWALRERVKELTCLYGIGRLAQRAGLSLQETLQGILELLPPAWQFPEIACARIVLDGRALTTPGFRDGPHHQVADIVVSGRSRGLVEVVYTEERPEFAEGPFLKEERSLIDTLAREIALIVEQREAEEYRSRLQVQLGHADRLATIGQLAAGVAHELNEPLGSILGFAQLIGKDPKLPKRTANDVEKIVKASLHAREVIQNLLIFARQKTPLKTQVNLNRIVEEGLYFLESRCAKAGINLSCVLTPDLPEINADPSQLQQVLVNLVVNGIQAMPEGGTLTIATHARQDYVSLTVTDTGVGMTEEVKEKIFTPFYTTKDVDQGTGLGLAVVHGIVSAHGGSIRVKSAPGQGARFEVQLPSAVT